MNRPQTRRLAGFAVVASAAVIVALAPDRATQAQASPAEIVVGTYQPQQAAEQAGLNEQLVQAMSGLQERMVAAQQQGDQQAMQQIQAEARQVQQGIVQEFQTKIEQAMPAVAETAGVDIIAVQIAYTADGIATKDVTQNVVAELNGGKAMPSEQPEVQFRQ